MNNELFKGGKCCACEKPIPQDDEYVNSVQLDYIAEWEFPIMKNFLIKDDVPRVVAILCDPCSAKGLHEHEIKFAVKFTPVGLEYILISSLKKAPFLPNTIYNL